MRLAAGGNWLICMLDDQFVGCFLPSILLKKMKKEKVL